MSQIQTPRSALLLVWRWFRLAAITYLIILLLMVFFENHLVYPGARFDGEVSNPNPLSVEDVYFQSADGTRLHGWYLEHPQPRAHVLFCHGNGETVPRMASYLESLRETLSVSIFVFDYRGYGRSEGRPDEAGIYADGDAAHEWLAQRTGIDRGEVVLMGRSLGGGVAVQLAATRGARGLVLDRTFTSLPDIAASRYWWVPVYLLMRNRFDSLSRIGRYHGPLLQCHGTTDNIVDLKNGKRLFEAAPSEHKRFVEMPGVGHNDPGTTDYYHELTDFLENLPSRSP